MKYYVYVKEAGQDWEECGEGPLGKATAERIAKEIRQECCDAKVLTEREHQAQLPTKPWDIVKELFK